MGWELVKVGKYLDDSIEKYSKTFYRELNKKEAEEEYDEEELLRARWSMVALQKVNKDLHYPSSFDRFHVISDMLFRNHHDGYNTEFVFLDGSKIIVSPDMLADFEDGYLVLYNKEYAEEHPTEVRVKDCVYNLLNLKEVNTIRKPV